jgi:transposase
MKDTAFVTIADWEGIRVMNDRCCGLDLSSSFHCAYLPPHLVGEAERNFGDGGLVKDFNSDHPSLEELATWLKSHGVKQVVMEATGIYWFGVYRVLHRQGFELCVVNPKHSKHIAGRKTDENDARWLCRLHCYGLLKASFVVEESMWELRDLMRQRDSLIKDRTRYVQYMISQLDQMNVKLHKVISDVTGKTGMAVIRCIAQGRPGQDMDWSKFYNPRLQKPVEEFVRVLQGDYRVCGCFQLNQALRLYDCLSEQIEEVDRYVERILFCQSQGIDQPEVKEDLRHSQEQAEQGFLRPLMGKRGKPVATAKSKNTPLYDQAAYLKDLLGVDMTTLPGIESATVLDIVAEIGYNLKDKFATQHHFTSWLQLSPKPKISGGKQIGKHKVTSVNRVHVLFRNCAYSLANSKGYFGQYYRSIKMRSNGKTANKALARKLACLFYLMITEKQPFDESRLQDPQQQQQKYLQKLQRMARKAGYELQPKEQQVA